MEVRRGRHIAFGRPRLSRRPVRPGQDANHLRSFPLAFRPLPRSSTSMTSRGLSPRAYQRASRRLAHQARSDSISCMQQDSPSTLASRHVPRWVAGAVADFEIFGHDVVSTDDVATALGVAADSRPLKNAIQTLVRLGWLRPLPARGRYEFLGARGGPFPSGDPLIEARAVRSRRPDFRLAIVGTGAAFLRGFETEKPAFD